MNILDTECNSCFDYVKEVKVHKGKHYCIECYMLYFAKYGNEIKDKYITKNKDK